MFLIVFSGSWQFIEWNWNCRNPIILTSEKRIKQEHKKKLAVWDPSYFFPIWLITLINLLVDSIVWLIGKKRRFLHTFWDLFVSISHTIHCSHFPKTKTDSIRKDIKSSKQLCQHLHVYVYPSFRLQFHAETIRFYL